MMNKLEVIMVLAAVIQHKYETTEIRGVNEAPSPALLGDRAR